MRSMRLIPAVLLALGIALGVAVIARAADLTDQNPPPKQDSDRPPKPDGNTPDNPDAKPGNGPGGQQSGRRGPPGGFHLIPRFAEEKLALTDDQKTKIQDLEKETKDKLSKILTSDQLKTLETMRPPRPGQGRGEQGGPGGDRPGQGNGNSGEKSDRPAPPQ